ncbi:MAG: hypothetical protein KZQ83_12945 [gamma proteobacterium symbiont of Taylorina sp.]|nr:hypothetical protein [gamma proteobacterium symbiont of Taylorina sp.]
MKTESVELSQNDKEDFEQKLTGLRDLILTITNDENTADGMIENIMDIIFIPEDEPLIQVDGTANKEAVIDLMSSETFQQITTLSKNDTDGIKAGLSTSIFNLCLALDEKVIHFEREEDKATMLKLLGTSLIVFFDGQVPTQKLQAQ